MHLFGDRRHGDDDDPEIRDVVDQRLVERQPAERRDDLNRMPGLLERAPQRDQLGMPDREHHVAAANRLGARDHGVCGHSRQSFVDHVLVGLAAAERRWIGRAGVAVGRFDEHEARRWHIGGRRRQIERPIEEPLRPGIADRDQALFICDAIGHERRQRSGARGRFLASNERGKSLGPVHDVRVKASRYSDGGGSMWMMASAICG